MDNESLLNKGRKRLTGFAAYCGLELDTMEPGKATGRCKLREELLNPYGMAHGGAINTILDTIGGLAASSAIDPPHYLVTRSADVHYLRPISGEVMFSRAEVIKAGKQMCLVRAEVFDEKDRLCAEGLLEFFYLDEIVE